MRPDISIVIINYNTATLVLNCIASIKRETKSVSQEIIVVDNASNENAQVIKEKYPEVRLVFLKENVGFGAGNNVGIKMSNGRYILLLNSDTIICDNALDKVYSFMECDFAVNNNIGLVGCKLVDETGNVQQSVFGKSASAWTYFIYSNPILNKLFRSPDLRFDYDCIDPQFVEGVSGAFMFLRREVFEKVKPFDPDLFMYSEETELCRNRISKWYKVAYISRPKIIHLGGKSAPKEIMYYQNMLSSALVWYKDGYLRYVFYISVSLINIISSLMLIPVAGAKGRNELKRTIKGYFKILPYLFFDIPKYKSEWGSRPRGLKLSELAAKNESIN